MKMLNVLMIHDNSDIINSQSLFDAIFSVTWGRNVRTPAIKQP